MINGGERVKGSWSPQEDANLIKLVEQHGPRNWSMISFGIPGRSDKSCCLRWCNQLSPTMQHRPFTPAEDAIIIQGHAVQGNKWATIDRLLPGRTENAIKIIGTRLYIDNEKRRCYPRRPSRTQWCQYASESDSGNKRQCLGVVVHENVRLKQGKDAKSLPYIHAFTKRLSKISLHSHRS